MTRWEDRRGRTKTLEREAGEGIQKYGETSGNQQYPDEPKRGSPQQRCLNMPAANPPRHVTCDDSRSNNEEYCGADNREYSPHFGNSTCRLASCQKAGKLPSRRIHPHIIKG